MDPRLRPRLVSRRAAARAGGRPARRRLGRDDRVGSARARRTTRPGVDDPDDAAGLRALLSLEVLRRQLDARTWLRRAAGGVADRRTASAVEAGRRDDRSGARDDLLPSESGRGDRRDAAIFDLAAAGC